MINFKYGLLKGSVQQRLIHIGTQIFKAKMHMIKEMSMLRRGNLRSGWIMFLMIVCGLVIGGFLGELLGKYLPVLKFGYNLGVSPHTWNLNILQLTFGLTFNINMFSILGIALGIYIYSRL
mgnify:CR=1 FL=1